MNFLSVPKISQEGFLIFINCGGHGFSHVASQIDRVEGRGRKRITGAAWTNVVPGTWRIRVKFVEKILE